MDKSMLQFGFEMSPLCVFSLVFCAVMLRSGASGRWLNSEGFDVTSGLIHWWILKSEGTFTGGERIRRWGPGGMLLGPFPKVHTLSLPPYFPLSPLVPLPLLSLPLPSFSPCLLSLFSSFPPPLHLLSFPFVPVLSYLPLNEPLYFVKCSLPWPSALTQTQK